MTKTYELPNKHSIMADVDEKHHTATVSVYALDDLVRTVNKTGHWIHFAASDDCSECGWSTGKYISPSNFCPNCGVKMLESEE